MKNAAWIGIGILTVANVVGAFINVNYNQELKLKNVLFEAECRVLAGEVRQMAHTASTAQTYEEGYRDALIRMGGEAKGTYADGYAAATTLYRSANYADGYHAAIGQFATSWNDPGTPKPNARSSNWPVGVVPDKISQKPPEILVVPANPKLPPPPK